MSLLCSSTILVNNATYFVVIDFRSINANILDSHYGINIRGTCLLTVELARQIEGKHDGRFINMVLGQDNSLEPGNLAHVATNQNHGKFK